MKDRVVCRAAPGSANKSKETLSCEEINNQINNNNKNKKTSESP